MEIPTIILLLGILIFASFYFNRFFISLRIPSALFFVVTGVILGLFVDVESYFGKLGGTFAAITLNVIIYMVGKRFNFKNIRRVPGNSLMFTIFNVIVGLVLVTVAARFIAHMSWISSLFLGFVLSGTSSVLIVPIVQSLRLKEKSRKVLIYESLITDIICLIGGLLFFDFIWQEQMGNLPMGGFVAKSVLLGLLSGFIAGALWIMVLRTLKHVKNTMFASLAFILILFGISEIAGFNGGFAVLAFGIMSGNINHSPFKNWFTEKLTEKAREYAQNEQSFFDELLMLIQAYFFVYMGMKLEYYSTWVFLIALVLVVIFALMRWVSVKSFSSKNLDYKEMIIMSVLSPKGIIPAVLVTLAFEMGVVDGLQLMQYGYAVIIVSLIVGAILISIARKDPAYFSRVSGKVLNPGKQIKDDRPDTIEEN
ncbi:MAG: cation:proton antiporter [Candidatus Delongbacteria bacterium]|jgi:cell volume regulation protein A|nr:cation:proton antiporter [Candidatus Delongbacteria bacterium]